MGSDGANRNVKTWGHRVKNGNGGGVQRKRDCMKRPGDKVREVAEKESSGGHGRVPSRLSDSAFQRPQSRCEREGDRVWCLGSTVPALRKLRQDVTACPSVRLNCPAQKETKACRSRALQRTGHPGT